MSLAEFRKLERVFAAAKDLAPRRRAEYVDASCGDDPELRSAVLRLLANDDDRSSFLDHPVEIDRSGAAPRPERIGPYRILEVLGEGGMGVVYRAEQERPRRQVGLKVIRPGIPTARALARFHLEANVLGKLQHPGIAQVYDVGTIDTGNGVQPFFAMELVRGEPVTRYAEAHGLGTRERLALVAGICDAVHHAHERGVIHRDLKPANLLVDDAGRPRILDFGIARATDADLRTTTQRTDVGQLIGTIPYMSPEQAAGDPDELDSRSDVYALGVVAYELLAGRLPHDLRGKMIHEAVRVIREDDPTPLSSINRVFRGDVETVVGKALEKERDRRYQSAADFAADIRRYLGDEPVLARAPSTVYQLRKFARRNRAVVAGVGAVFIVLLLGLAGTSAGLLIARQQRDQAVAAHEDAEQARAAAETQRRVALQARDAEARLREEAERQARIAQAVNDFLNDDLLAAVAPEAAGREVSMRSVLDIASESVEGRFESEPVVLASIHLTLGRTYMSLGRHDAAEAHLAEALDLLRDEVGETHRDTLHAMEYLAHVLQERGRPDEAEPLAERLLEIRNEQCGPFDVATLQARYYLATIYQAQARYDEALELHGETVEGYRRELGDEHADTASAMHVLGMIQLHLGRFEEAERWLGRAVDVRRRVLCADHPDTLTAVDSLGHLLRLTGRHEQAEPLFLEVYRTRVDKLGREHPDTLASMDSLAQLYAVTRRFEDAGPLLTELLELRRRVLGETHGLTLFTTNYLGNYHLGLDQPELAEGYYDAAYQASRRVRGPDDVYTLTYLSNVAMARAMQARHAEALPLFEQAIEGMRAAMPADYWGTASAMLPYAERLIALERYADAETALLDARRTLEAAVGADHRLTLNTLPLLVVLYERWDRPEDAARWTELIPPALRRAERR